MKKQNFEVKDIHITLLKNAYIGWNDCEFGAPTIDCKRPYGNSSVYSDIAVFCEFNDDNFTTEQIDYMTKVHQETQIVLQIFLVTGRMEPGFYESDEYKNNWRKINWPGDNYA